MPLHLPHDLYTQLRLAVTEADEYRLTPQALAALQNEPRPEPVAAPPLDPRNPFTLLPSAAAVLQHLYEQAPFVGGFLAQINGLITPLLSIISSAPDAGIAATLQLDTNHYTSAHAIQVAALIVVIIDIARPGRIGEFDASTVAVFNPAQVLRVAFRVIDAVRGDARAVVECIRRQRVPLVVFTPHQFLEPDQCKRLAL